MPQTRNFAQQRPLGRPRGPSPCAGPDNGGSQPLTMHASKTIFLQCCCSAKTRDMLLTAVIFTSLTFATQPAGPWIRKRSRRGTQAWQFLSNGVPIALQVYLKTLRRQQHQPHPHALANKNPHASKRKRKDKKHKKQQRTEVYHSITPSSSSHESASARSDRPTHQQQLHTNVSDTHTTTTATSARTGVALRSRACAKMLVRAGHRCPCHFLRECPSALFMQPVTLTFHDGTDNDTEA